MGRATRGAESGRGELMVRPADIEPHTVYLVRMLGRHGSGTFTYAATGFDPQVGVRSDEPVNPRRRPLLQVELHAVPLPVGVDVWPPHLDPDLRDRLTDGHPTTWRWLDTIHSGDYPVAVLAARCCSAAEWPTVAAELLRKRIAASANARQPAASAQ